MRTQSEVNVVFTQSTGNIDNDHPPKAQVLAQQMPRVESRINQLWAHEKASYGLRVFIALAVATSVCWHLDQLLALPPLYLGTISAAIAETDDNWLGRTKAVVLSLVCFSIAAIVVQWLFPYPWLFVPAIAISTFSIWLIGALGERYASISLGTVSLAIYAMLGLDHYPANSAVPSWQSTALLLVGAAWYSLLSILWTALFANRPVRERLARLYSELGLFLTYKAALFEPVRHLDEHPRLLKLAQQNARVVEALNIAKAAILSRFGRSGRPGVQSGLYFHMYYMAQDFHERASSSHYVYHELTDAFFHSDVMYRCQRLLTLQGGSCNALGDAIKLRTPFQYDPQARQASTDLRQSLAFLHAQHNPNWTRLLGSLGLLGSNLQSIERQLSEAADSKNTLDNIDTRLQDSSPHTLREMAMRIAQQFSLKSLLFRHGLRMSIALVTGYLLMQALQASHGYWILLTIALTCRPNYGATRLRLIQRIFGTFIGVGLTWTLMQLFESTEFQLLLAFFAALVFFVTRTDRYLVATAAITVMALLCFNLLGDGFLLLWPRLIDTLVGCAITAAAAFLILPDWQGRRLHIVMGNVLNACASYLDEVLAHYRESERDDLRYRIARRDMHNTDAALSAALSNMVREPGYKRRNLEAGFRFLALSNTLLGYLSALGAHRAQLSEHADDALIAMAGNRLKQGLQVMTQALATRTPAPDNDEELEALADTLEQMPTDIDDKHRLLRTQLSLALRLLPRLRAAADSVTATPRPETQVHTEVTASSH